MIISLEPRDIPAAAKAFADGFLHDPVYSHILQAEPAPYKALYDFFRAYISECKGLKLYKYGADEGYLVFYFSDEIADWTMETPLFRRLARHFILDDHYCDGYGVLDLMTVRPAYRGKGIAGEMIGFFCTECEKRNVRPLTEIFDGTHVPLYAAHGFVPAHRKTVDGVTTYVLEKYR